MALHEHIFIIYEFSYLVNTKIRIFLKFFIYIRFFCMI
nr:MAG TPA: hypothetical protein [Caudoviricetes sp.]